jgi:murein DD-endopeptidase MepM/ murein hydrolase activator NlpD
MKVNKKWVILLPFIIRPRTVFPANGKISSGYGVRQFETGPDLHTGIDIQGRKNGPVYASKDGRVVNVWSNGQIKNYGNLIVIQHSNKLYSLYAHLSKVFVKQKEIVIAGQIIGKIGTTAGNSKNLNRSVPAHLHFEFLNKWPPDGVDLNRINPKDIFKYA